MDPQQRPPRQLSLADCVGIGVNGIVGSGIYLLVAPLSARAGAASVLGVLGCGALCMLIALCFAELSSMFDRSGGPYVFARAAFGPGVGFAVGWLGAATGMLGFAAVSVGLAAQLASSFPALEPLRPALSLGVIALLGGINYLGVKAGGRTSTVLSVVKLVPLLLLAVAGLWHVRPELLASLFHAPSVPGAEPRPLGQAITSSAFLAIFMMSGFEYASVPAGEVREPRRTIPLAVLTSLAGASLLYAALQLGALAALPQLRSALPPDATPAVAHPLVEASAVLFGPLGPKVLGPAALLSMLGFCASVALVAPRYLVALAEDRILPSRLLSVSRFGTPGLAIAASTALTCGLALLLGYKSLVDVSNVVILSGYAGTCVACGVLRLRNPEAPRAVRLPGGVFIPALAAGAAVLLLWSARPRAQEWLFTGQLVALGFALWAATVLSRRFGLRSTPREQPQA